MTGHGNIAVRFGGLLLLIFCAALPRRAAAQEISPLTAALRLAQDGRIDSARAVLKRMEDSTPPTDTLYPGILYSSALVAPTAEEVRRQLQRVILGYPISSWAAPATIALGQLEYANGDPAAAARTLEKFRTDNAASPLYPIAALWGARADFDANNQASACQWVSDGMSRASDASTQAELVALSRRCNTPTAAPPARDTARAPSPAPAVVSAPVPAPATATPPPPVPAAERPAPPVFRVQVVAANSQDAADEMLDRAKKAGFSGVIVKEGGFFKVRLGEYATRTEASAAAAKAKARLGGSPFVVAP